MEDAHTLGTSVIIGIAIVIIFMLGIRIIRPTHRGLVERLGKYKNFAVRVSTG